MRISKKAGYALRALAVMARRGGSSSIHDLSERERIPVKFLEQILLTLRHAGLLRSKRGVGGGYALARPAAEISILDIVQALDGPVSPLPCTDPRPTEPCTCPDPRICPTRMMMTEFRSELIGWLGKRTLDDLSRLAPESGGLAFEI
jgi:Rrf2 family protein